MIDLQNPGPPQGPGQPPLSPDAFRQQARAIQDENPTAFDSLILPPPEKQGSKKQAFGRGMVEGANQASDATVGLGGWLVKHMAPEVAPGKEGQHPAYEKWRQDFLDWYDSGRSSEINPLRVGEATLDKVFGKKQTGLGGFIEGVGQVATGMIATGGLAIEGMATKAIVQGALIDGAFFDPYQKRLANMAQDASIPIASDLASFLASDPNDNEAVARFKAVVEGVVVGKVLGTTFHAINAARLQRAAKLGKFAGGTKESAEKAIASELELAANPKPTTTDAINVVENSDGSATVNPTGNGKADKVIAAAWEDAKGNRYQGFNHADAADQAAEQGIDPSTLITDGFVTRNGRFLTRDQAVKEFGISMSPAKGGFAPPAELHFETTAEAQSFAASVNEAEQSAALPPINVSPETLALFRARVGKLTEASSPEEIDNLFQSWGTDFNFSRVSSPADVKVQIEALSRELPSITEMARALGTQPHEVTTKLAQQLNQTLDAGEAVAMAKRLFGDTKDLPQKLLAARSWLYAKGAEVSRLSKIVDGAEGNAVAMHELTTTLDQLWDFHAAAAGTASNVGRSLESLKIDPTPLAESIAAREGSAGEQLAQDASQQIEAKVTGKSLGQQTTEAAKAAEANGKAPKAPDAPAQPTPEQAAVRQAAEDALQDLKRARADMVNKRFNKDTPHTAAGNDAPNATDFSLANARKKAAAAIESAKAQGMDVHEGPVSAEVAAHGEQKSRDVLAAADAQRVDPLDAAAGNGAKAPANPMDELSKTLDQEERQLESILNPKAKVAGAKAPNPVGDFIKANNEGGRAPGSKLSGGLTKRELQGLARQIRLAEGNPDQILKALYAQRASKIAKGDATLVQRIIGYRMNAMLSGPKTLIINAASNAMAAVQRPVEFWWAGVRTGNKELQSMGSDMLVGLGSELSDSFRAGWKSFVAGENLIDKSYGQAFEDRTAELAAQGGKTWLQTTLSVPSRVLMSTDEFFKQLNYRTNVRAQALRDARELGMTEPKDIAEHVESTLQSAFALGTDRSATNPIALDYARVSTFTNDLGDGTIGKWIQEGAIKHPMIRLIMPFVRTPVNLFRWTWERTPGLARFSNTYKEAIAAGGERAAVAKSKVELGSALYSAAAFYAVSGNVTGAGPSSPELRKQWLNAGNQPYSIKVPGTETWISYRRADPVVTPVGLAATAVDNLRESGKKIASAARIRNLQRDGSDGHPVGEMFGLIADFAHASGEIAEEDGTRMATAFIASIAANVSSKTFLQGAVEWMDAMAGGEPYKVQNMLTNMAASFIPNIVRQINPDDTIRETRGLFDEIVGRTPWSAGLEPQRNIFGEPVLRAPGYINRAFNPFTLSSKPSEPTVADELVGLGRAMTMPSEERLGGLVKLTDRSKFYNPANTDEARKNQSPYDRMLEIMANPGNDTPSLKDALTRLVKSDSWSEISDGTAAQPGGEKYKLAAQIIGQYQDMALARVKGEYPELAKALATEDAQRAAAALQGEAGVAAVQKLFQPQ